MLDGTDVTDVDDRTQNPLKINFRIKHDDCLVRFYTGFIKNRIFLALKNEN